jgi:hypothetical protein
MAFLLVACRSADTPERVAITFLELYVFKVDQKSALELSADAAADKLRREIADVQSARTSGDDFASDPRRPALSRRLLESAPDDDSGWRFLYEIAVRPKGATPYERNIELRVAPREGKWRVVDYNFINEPATQTP